MSLWSDYMVDLIENIKSDPITYYIGLLIGIALLILIISLIVKNDKKKKARAREIAEEKQRIEKHVDLETMIAQMQEQEQSKLKDIDPVANFEQEQEEKAIISYQELVNAVKTENKESINVINVSSTGDVISTSDVPRVEQADDKPIFIDEIKLPKSEIEFDPQEDLVVEPVINITEKNDINTSNKQVEIESNEDKNISDDFLTILNSVNNKETKKANDKVPINYDTLPIKEIEENKTIKNSSTKFKNSEFISPIYGRQNSNISYPKISSFKVDSSEDEVINISSDIDPNDEFLKTLRDFRNN